MNKKLFAIFMIVALLLASVGVSNAKADDIDITETPVVVVAEAFEVVTEEPTELVSETQDQTLNEIPLPTATPTIAEILDPEVAPTTEIVDLNTTQVVEVAELQVSIASSSCEETEEVCEPNSAVDTVEIVEVVTNWRAEEALEQVIEDAENGTPIENFNVEISLPDDNDYHYEIGEFVTIYNEETGSTIVAVVTDCRLGVYVSVDPLFVVSANGQEVDRVYVRQDESYVEVSVPDGETVSLTVYIPHEEPVTISVTGICQNCYTVTPTIVVTDETPSQTLTPTYTPTPTVIPCEETDYNGPDHDGCGEQPTATLTVTPTQSSTPSSTPTASNTPVFTQTITPTPTRTPVITSTPKPVVEENGEQEKTISQSSNVGTCVPTDRIVITKWQDGTADNWLYDTNLENGLNTTANLDGLNFDPSFDPNNPCIRFVYSHTMDIQGNYEIWIYDGENKPIVNEEGETLIGFSPDWGVTDKIAYVFQGTIWIVNSDGTNAFDTGLYGNQPEWSWDGKALIFVSLNGMLSGVETETWTHIGEISEIPMEAPVITADQKMICGSSIEGCEMLTIENNPGINDLLYNGYTSIAVEPNGEKVLVRLNEKMLVIRSTGKTLIAEENVTFDTIMDWFTADKAEMQPINSKVGKVSENPSLHSCPSFSSTYTGVSIVDFLKSVNQPSSWESRSALMETCGATSNTELLNMIRD